MVVVCAILIWTNYLTNYLLPGPLTLRAECDYVLLPRSSKKCPFRFSKNNFSFYKKLFLDTNVACIFYKFGKTCGTNVACIFYKFGKTCGTKTHNDIHLRMEGVLLLFLIATPSKS
jgi:hypothetical protein